MPAKKKITCKSFLEEVNGYIEGDLPPDLKAQLEAHMAKCPDCWVLVDETRKTVEIVQTYDCHPMPKDVQDRLLAALNEHWTKSG